MTTRVIMSGHVVWERVRPERVHVYEPAPHMGKLPEVSDRTLAHGIYHRHIHSAPAEQGWMERAQLLDWANIESSKFIEAACSAKLLDCAIDMQTKVEVYRVLNPTKMLPFTLEWKTNHQVRNKRK